MISMFMCGEMSPDGVNLFIKNGPILNKKSTFICITFIMYLSVHLKYKKGRRVVQIHPNYLHLNQ